MLLQKQFHSIVNHFACHFNLKIGNLSTKLRDYSIIFSDINTFKLGDKERFDKEQIGFKGTISCDQYASLLNKW